MTENLKRGKIETILKEAKWWALAAWTLPFVALSVVLFEYWLGWDSMYVKATVIVSVIFFSVSVYWWWWAITRIVKLSEINERNLEGWSRVEKEIAALRQDIKESPLD